MKSIELVNGTTKILTLTESEAREGVLLCFEPGYASGKVSIEVTQILRPASRRVLVSRVIPTAIWVTAMNAMWFPAASIRDTTPPSLKMRLTKLLKLRLSPPNRLRRRSPSRAIPTASGANATTVMSCLARFIWNTRLPNLSTTKNISCHRSIFSKCG